MISLPLGLAAVESARAREPFVSVYADGGGGAVANVGTAGLEADG